MLRTAFGVIIILAVSGTTPAQTTSPHPDGGPSTLGLLGPSTTAYTVGYFDVDFRYASSQTASVYSFNGPAMSLMISTQTSSFTVAYGTSPAVATETEAGTQRSMIDIALITGGNVDVFSAAAPVPFGTYIPIRVHLGYRNLTANRIDGESPPTAHLPTAALGAGGGAWVRIPTDVPLIRDRLVAFGSLTVAFGGLGEVSDSFSLDDTRLTRTTDFNLEARLERFLANRTGLTVGYTFRTASWSDAYILDLIESPDHAHLSDFSHRSQQHLLRVGFNW